jgi:DNA-binding transcriptional LysR family regulator
MSAVSSRVLDGSATLGVVSPLGVVPGLERRVLSSVRMIPVVAPTHPLAVQPCGVPTSLLAEFVQIVLSERHESGVPDQAVLSPRSWRVADLHAKHAMLRAGLGWGNLPEHVVRDDLRTGRLIELSPAAWGPDEHRLYLSAIYRSDTPFGPAHRWLLEALEALCNRDLEPEKAKEGPRPARGSNRTRSPRGG